VRRPEKWHFDTQLPRNTRDFFILRADHDARQPAAGLGGVGRISQQRPPRQSGEILSRNPLGSAARRDDTENVQY
jgi:hypothetical protein